MNLHEYDSLSSLTLLSTSSLFTFSFLALKGALSCGREEFKLRHGWMDEWLGG